MREIRDRASGAAALHTAHEVDVAVNLVGSLGAAPCSGVEAVHVLGHERESVTQPALNLHQGMVRSIGCGLPTRLPAPEVPRPHQLGVCREGRPRRQFLGMVDATALGPEAFRAAEGRDTALGADPRTGEDQETSSAQRDGPDGLDRSVRH